MSPGVTRDVLLPGTWPCHSGRGDEGKAGSGAGGENRED